MILALSVFSATAALEIVDDKVILPVDYEGFDTDDEETISETTNDFTIKNTGTSNITVTITATGLPVDYSVVSDKEVTIQAGESVSTSIAINIPHEESTGETTIGSIQITGAGETVTKDLVQDTAFMLIVKEIEISYKDEDGKSQKDDFDAEDDDNFDLEEKVQPDSDISFKLDIENRFPDEDYNEGEIEDLEIEVEVDDDDILPEDFESTIDITSLNADESETVKFEFSIPEDVPSGDYTFEFTIDAKDGKNVRYKIVREVTLEIERERNDIRITEAKLSPNGPYCPGTPFNLNLEVKNLGTKNQKHVAISIANKDLNIDESVEELELDEFGRNDDEFQRSFRLDIPQNAAKKEHNLIITTSLDKVSRPIDTEVVILDVQSCSGTTATPSQDDDDNTSTTVITTTLDTTGDNRQDTTTSPANTQIGEGVILQTIENPNNQQETLLFALLLVAVVLLVAMIGLFLAILLKK
ncbi:hypothetical protein HOI26_05720 [Candidatus Woesearchaeota archaeon]|nr:hypothetical protein [Candidatus Woesearchaeota archaeon]MBT5740565.1 hypothetical protein [Candidatus Woesearchaeota archaeon]